MVPAGGADEGTNIAFVPLAMPLMCGPGAIATILGMASTIKQSPTELASFVAIVAAILATMFVTYLCLIYAGKLSEKLGPMGIDAITRIVGFFVSAMGVALIFDGVIEEIRNSRRHHSALIAYVACPDLPCRHNSVSRKKTYVQFLKQRMRVFAS